jgi:death-on-curing protein
MARDWVWISVAGALAAHSEQLVEHGGGEGVRDTGLLESALARLVNLAAHGEPDAADLAASYAYGVARNHPFIDGNKRTAVVVSEAFLLLNGFMLDATDADIVVTFLALAAGELSEVELAAWFRARIVA